MLAKKYKIPGRYRIERVFEKGRRLSGKYFSLHYFPNRVGPRFAVVVPTRLKPKAVLRNRMRRRLFEVIRLVVWPPTDSLKAIGALGLMDKKRSFAALIDKKRASRAVDKIQQERYAFCRMDIILLARTLDIATAPLSNLIHEFLQLSSKIGLTPNT